MIGGLPSVTVGFTQRQECCISSRPTVETTGLGNSEGVVYWPQAVVVVKVSFCCSPPGGVKAFVTVESSDISTLP